VNMSSQSRLDEYLANWCEEYELETGELPEETEILHESISWLCEELDKLRLGH
jgi:hypothetical protein